MTFIVFVVIVIAFLLFVLIKILTLKKVQEEYATLVEITGVKKGQESAKEIYEDVEIEEKGRQIESNQHMKDEEYDKKDG